MRKARRALSGACGVASDTSTRTCSAETSASLRAGAERATGPYTYDYSNDLILTLQSFSQDNQVQLPANAGNSDASPPQVPVGRVSGKAPSFLAHADAAVVRGLSQEGLILCLLIPQYPFVLLLPYFPNLLPCSEYATKTGASATLRSSEARWHLAVRFCR